MSSQLRLRNAAHFVCTAAILASLAACGGDDSAGPTEDGGSTATGGSGTSTTGEGGGGGQGGQVSDGTDFEYAPSNLDDAEVNAGGPDVTLTADCTEQ